MAAGGTKLMWKETSCSKILFVLSKVKRKENIHAQEETAFVMPNRPSWEV